MNEARYYPESMTFEQRGWRGTCMGIAYPVQQWLERVCDWLAERELRLPRWLQRLAYGRCETWQATFMWDHVLVTSERGCRNVDARIVLRGPDGESIQYCAEGVSAEAGVPFMVRRMPGSLQECIEEAG